MYETVLSQLMERFGWPVLAVQSDSCRLQVSSRLGDASIKVEGFGDAFVKGRAFGQGPRLCFIRFELGRPEGQPSRWGLIKRREITAQVTSGSSWIVAATSLMLSDLTLPTDQYRLGSLFMLVKRLFRHGDAEGGPIDRDWPFEGLSQPLIGRDSFSLRIGGGTLMASALVGTIGTMAIGDLALLLFYPFSCVGLGGFLMFASGHMRKKAIYRAHRQAWNTSQTVATSRVFDARDELRASMPLWFPVVGAGAGIHRLVEAVLQTALLEARSTTQDLFLRIKLHAVEWPGGTEDACKVLPTSWATVEVHGPSGTLDHLPSRPFEERIPMRVRWQMGADELEKGGLSEWLRQIDAAFYGAKTGPYR